jgi:hypothetical protein
MIIPIEVSYRTVGKNKTRNVIGVLCPTALTQVMNFSNVAPIYVDMGDMKVDWNLTSPGFEMLLKNGLLEQNLHIAKQDD